MFVGGQLATTHFAPKTRRTLILGHRRVHFHWVAVGIVLSVWVVTDQHPRCHVAVQCIRAREQELSNGGLRQIHPPLFFFIQFESV